MYLEMIFTFAYGTLVVPHIEFLLVGIQITKVFSTRSLGSAYFCVGTYLLYEPTATCRADSPRPIPRKENSAPTNDVSVK